MSGLMMRAVRDRRPNDSVVSIDLEVPIAQHAAGRSAMTVRPLTVMTCARLIQTLEHGSTKPSSICIAKGHRQPGE